MLAQLSEQKMHRIKWLFVIGWFILIFSLFYDPISPSLTSFDNPGSPFSLPSEMLTPQGCIEVQGKCIEEQPYAMGARIFWSMVVPTAIFVIFVFGHEFWRRICPLSFLSQIPTALGIQRKQKVVNPRTGKHSLKLAIVSRDSWLGRNHLYLQFGLLFLGLVGRILFTNSHRTILGIFLLLTIVSAIAVGYLYGGKSWCQYFCPMAPVQTVFTGPRGLLGTSAHQEPKLKITQSMCRVVDDSGKEVSGCVGCKSPCIDIDAEKTYWEELRKPGRSLVQYGYFGLMFAFHFYFFAYAGNWDYYFSGVWTHKENQLATVFAPGFYLFGSAIPIPKLFAVVLTFAVFSGISYLFFLGLEKIYRAYCQHFDQSTSFERSRHIVFSICTTLSFWVFFRYGGRTNLNLLPAPIVEIFDIVVIFLGSIWLYRTLQRDRESYNRERLGNSLRKQLRKFNYDFSEFLGRRSLENLNPDELYVLAKVLPGVTQQERERLYFAVMRETLEEGIVSVAEMTKVLRSLRQELGLDEAKHDSLLDRFLDLEIKTQLQTSIF